MKKSVVAISACSSLSRYTAASSAVSMPTSSSLGIGMRRRALEDLRQHAGCDLAAAAAAVREAGEAQGRGRRVAVEVMAISGSGRTGSPLPAARHDQSHDQLAHPGCLDAGRTAAPARRTALPAARATLRRCRSARSAWPALRHRRPGSSPRNPLPAARHCRRSGWQHRYLRANCLDHDVGAAFHPAHVDERARPRDPASRGGLRQRAEPAVARAGRHRAAPPRPAPGRARRRSSSTRAAAGGQRRSSVSGDFSARRWPTATRSPCGAARVAAPHRGGRLHDHLRLGARRRAGVAGPRCSTTRRLAHSTAC